MTDNRVLPPTAPEAPTPPRKVLARGDRFDRLGQNFVALVGVIVALLVLAAVRVTAVPAAESQAVGRQRVVLAPIQPEALAGDKLVPLEFPLGAGPAPAPLPTRPLVEAPPIPEPPPPAPAPGDAAQEAPAETVAIDPRLVPFSGLATWVDLYDTSLTPQEQAGVAAASGVQAIFVQSARFNSPAEIHDPARLGQLLEAAHDAGILVMVWYLPDFVDPERDVLRSMHAMAFTSPRGDRPDGFGLDIESSELPDVPERTRRLLWLSQELRGWAGPDYPMAAITLPPLLLELNTTWWPGFPYAELRPLYDVFIPMSYSSYRGQDANVTYTWNLRNVQRIRELAGDPTLPVHLAGGIANLLPEVGAFLQAGIDGGVLGGSLYDLHTTPPAAWPVMAGFRIQR